MPSLPDRTIPPVWRFSTDDVPRAKGLAYWREMFGRSAVRANIEPRSTGRFTARARLETVPGFSVMSFDSTAASLDRTPQMLDDGDDALMLLNPQHGRLAACQRGREVTVRPGEAVLLLHGEPALVTHSDARFRGLVVPRLAVADRVRNVEDAATRRISADNPVLRLLFHYVSGISAELAHTSDRARSVIDSHVHDLVALVASCDTEPSPGKAADATGVSAARLAAIKADVVAHIGYTEVTIDHVAARHRLAPRTVQRLFEAEGSTFSAFKLEQQLVYSQRLLRAGRDAHPTIADIAYAAGFSDLSYFHRSFRRRFGITPAEYRTDAKQRLGLAKDVRNNW